MNKISSVVIVILFYACHNSTEETKTVFETERCNERWNAVKDTIIHTESVEFKNFISPLDSIEAILNSEKTQLYYWTTDSIYHRQYLHNGHPIKIVRDGTFESFYTHEYYIIDNCNVMLRRTDKYLEFPDSIQRIRTYGFNSDSISRAYLTSPSLGFQFQANITSQSQSSFKTIRTWFKNELCRELNYP